MELTEAIITRVAEEFGLGDLRDAIDERAIISLNEAVGTGKIGGAVRAIQRALDASHTTAHSQDATRFIYALRDARRAINALLGEE